VLALLLILAFRYKLFRRIKSLVSYIVFASVTSVALYSIGPAPKSYTDPSFYFYFYSYWISAFVLSFLRLYIILEICELVLREYPAVRAFGWRILSGLALVMFSGTAYFAVRNTHHLPRLILTFQQMTDMSFAVLLLTLMGIGVYYKMRIPPLCRPVLIGSCIYSAEQVVGSELGRITANLPYSVFDFAARICWFLMMAIWAWAVWRWADVPIRSPELVPQKVYDELSPQVHNRLRDLNARLARLVGQRFPETT